MDFNTAQLCVKKKTSRAENMYSQVSVHLRSAARSFHLLFTISQYILFLVCEVVQFRKNKIRHED